MLGTHHSKIFVVAILLFSLSLPHATAQDEPSVELKVLIAQLETRFNIKFSYVDADLEGIRINVPSSESLTTILDAISAQSQIEVQRLSNRYYTLRKNNLVSICGRILDNYAKNNVPGATVQVLGSDTAVVSDIDGNFLLEEVSRTASLQIRFLGYETKIVPVLDLLDQKDCAKILLAERREILNEVVVYEFLTSGITKETDGSISLTPGELGILPGLIEPDVLFGVQALPGIKSIDETVSDINVRGGTNDQNLILWNGIKMYQSGHFFGLISAFNPYLTESVSIYKNGTPAEFGDGVSSVINMETNNTITEAFYGGAGINFISGDVFGQVPIRDNLAFQFSARRSTTDFLDTPAYDRFTDRAFQDTEITNQQNQEVEENLEREETFFFYDLSAKLLYDLSDSHKFRLSFIGIDNDLDFSETNLEVDETSQSFLDQTNLSAGLQWFGNWSERFSTYVNVYFSWYNLDAQSFFPNQVQRLFQNNTVEERQAKFTSRYRFSDRFHWNNGYQYIETGITNEARVTEPQFDLFVKGVVRIQAPFSEVSYFSSNNNFIANLGVRANHIENLGTFSEWIFEPRLNLNVRLARNLRAQVLGEFKSQSTNQVIDLEQNFLGIEKRRWILSNEEDLPITKSKQGSLGLNYERKQFYVGVEAFYKEVDGVSTRTQGFQNQNQFDGEIGNYEVEGVEFLVNKKGKNYSTWLSYTYNQNEYTYDSIVPPQFPNNLDVRHTITFASTYDIDRLQLGLGLNYRTGRPFTQPDRDTPLDTSVFPLQINYEAPNSSRLPEYFRLDASATYNFSLGGRTRAKAGVSLLNLTNRKNILNRYFRVSEQDELESVENVSLGITPNVSLRLHF
ncbi:MAG: TonB-dependent receptor [Bacteroidota bacterium]